MRTVYRIARRWPHPPDGVGGLVYLSHRRLPWTQDQKLALTFAERDEAAARLACIQPEWAHIWVVWDQEEARV